MGKFIPREFCEESVMGSFMPITNDNNTLDFLGKASFMNWKEAASQSYWRFNQMASSNRRVLVKWYFTLWVGDVFVVNKLYLAFVPKIPKS